MPRANDKPVKCRDCRFCEKLGVSDAGICQLFPPLFPVLSHAVNLVSLRTDKCFQGEPMVERSCGNCKHRSVASCPLVGQVMITWKRPKGWSCSDWEGARE